MHFDISHVIQNIDLAAYERLYFDEPFNIALCQAVGLGRKLISLDKQPTSLRRVVEVVPSREIPKPLRRLMGDHALSYTETLDYDFKSHQGRWTTEPSLMSEKISSAGTLQMTPLGQDVQRRVTGEVIVRIFGLGTMIERFIAADVQASYDAAATLTQQYIAGERPVAE